MKAGLQELKMDVFVHSSSVARFPIRYDKYNTLLKAYLEESPDFFER